MEGQVGNIFETQFPHTVRNNGYTKNVQPPLAVNEKSSDKFVLISQETKNKHVNHMLRNSCIAAGIGVVLLAPVVMLAAKGKFPKTFSKYLTKRLDKLAEKIKVLGEKPDITKAEMLYLDSLQKTTSTLNSAKGLALNSGPLKDVLFEKFLRKIGLGKVCTKISGFFEKMAVKMSAIAYQKSGDAFTLMKESFSQVNKKLVTPKSASKMVEINGVSKTLEEWAKIAELKTQKIDTAYDAFRPQAVKKRYKWLSKQFNGLGAEVYERTYGDLKSFLKTPKKWTSFITEELAAPSKLKFSRTISSNKKIITNTHSDVVKELDTIIMSIENSLDMTSKESLDILKRLKKVVSGYNLNNSQGAKKEIMAEINHIIQDSAKVLNGESSQYTIPTTRKIRKSLGHIKHIIESDKKGEVEELLEIYKQILPKNEYEQVKKAAQKSRAALNDAVNTESDKFVDKMRDLKSGSALTDVGFGLLVPTVSTTVGMSMADTKEKKRSVALNLGVPLFVGLGTSMWGTVAMLAAGPSMLLGLVTSTIANQICSRIDKNLKKNDSAKLAQDSKA